jgi:hypothetical protein
MRLGIDLDNTIICYDEAFSYVAKQRELIPPDWSGSKWEVREAVRSTPNGEATWQAIQGDVYGPLISLAKLYSGVFRFLWRCNARGFEVEIVSHKTEFGHVDESKTPLRATALEFLREEQISIDNPSSLVGQVTFLDTREAKIAYIDQQRFDWFVDDLPEVLDNLKILSTTKKLGFAPDGMTDFMSAKKVRSWGEIESEILGTWTDDELSKVTLKIVGTKPREILWIGGRANSGIARIRFNNERLAALKLYALDDNHDRYAAEQGAFEILNQCGEVTVPKALGGLQRLSVGMLEWMPGDQVTAPNSDDIDCLLGFIKRLHGLRHHHRFRSFPNASAAIFSGWELQQQLHQRLDRLRSNSIDSRGLHSYLDDEFVPSLLEIASWTERSWPHHQFKTRLQNREMTLSPSDFGFHNCLKQEDGTLRFIDFEYFGWDDPAKLCGDFLFHPGMNLSDTLKRQWIKGARTIYGARVVERLTLMWGLIGLVWCLILLNEFRVDHRARRQVAQGNMSATSPDSPAARLRSSRRLLRQVQSQYRQPVLLT